MDNTKVVYENGNSKCIAEFDGEVIKITQFLNNDKLGSVFLYSDELESIMDFVKENE